MAGPRPPDGRLGRAKDELHVLCAAADGRTRWQKTVPATQTGKNSPMMSRAAPTPAVVVAPSESGDLPALRPDGTVRWQRLLAKQSGELRNDYRPAASQTDRTAQVGHQWPSYLVGVDQDDGTTVRTADRPARTS